jgi:hypothetical protein
MSAVTDANKSPIESNGAAGRAGVPSDRLSGIPADRGGYSAEGFAEQFGESLERVLDLETWRVGNDLNGEYQRIEKEVREAVEREDKLQKQLRAKVFPRLRELPNATRHAGEHPVTRNQIETVHQGLLFNGGVEACDGVLQVHDTLPLSVYQIGVSLVSYRGDQGTWCHRLFRRDLRQESPDLVEDTLKMLERRAERSDWSGDPYGELVQKALLGYAQRAILLHRSQATWRMGIGNPIPYELLTGGASFELLVATTKALRELIVRHQKFVFVGREPRERLLLTIGHALRPYEFAVIETLDKRLENWIHQKRFTANVSEEVSWDGERLSATEWIPRFIHEVASRVVVGVFRATPLSPAQLFYAHVDHADIAGMIAVADSVMQEQRGFPLLADLARHVCDGVFGDSLDGLLGTAYAAAGAPWRYGQERTGRYR